MSKIEPVLCKNCGAKLKVPSDFIKIYTSEKDYDHVRSGEVFYITCKKCKSRFNFECPFLYVDIDNKFVIFYINNDTFYDMAVDGTNELRMLFKDIDGMIVRVVSSNRELLYEKIDIFTAGLNDVIVETCKYELQRRHRDAEDIIFKYDIKNKKKEFVIKYKNHEELVGFDSDLYNSYDNLLKEQKDYSKNSNSIVDYKTLVSINSPFYYSPAKDN